MNNKLKLFFVTGLAVMLLAGCGGNQPAPEPTPAPTPAPQEERANETASADVIGEEQAKEIALTHAQVNAADAQFEKVELDEDDGRQEYDIEFKVNGEEYEYEIDAVTGEIISTELDD